ncbi:hypothetical protein EW146_g9488 [Bondarzewia mesenterica]|uniref:Uncharacterized protein n=1 Tax=Bondarzewia mesenterica TaxID=1095465 RepID=A0A4S4L640_9AGAM|nr:hypothetical protein EW146_g9488 [Bondarzewia mesenterica]
MIPFHLDMLEMGDRLWDLPVLQQLQKDQYSMFTQFTPLKVNTPDASRSERKERDGNDIEDRNNDRDVVDADDEWNEVKEELVELNHATRPKKYLQWLRLHANHFEAVNILSRFSVTSLLSENIKFSLLTVQRQKKPMMMPWHVAIEKTLLPTSNSKSQTTSWTAKSAFDTLTGLMRDMKGRDVDIPLKLKNYADGKGMDMQRSGRQGRPSVFKGNIHCEAALASLMISKESITGPDQLKSVIGNLDEGCIGVSKLCCPICWKVLSVLRGDSKTKFLVRGHHDTITPVDLPPWMPVEHLMEIVKIFRNYLHEALDVIMAAHGEKPLGAQQAGRGHKHTESIQFIMSEGGFSTNSDSSEGKVVLSELDSDSE